MKPRPRTILLASSEVNDSNVGEILIRDMLAVVPEDSVERLRLCSESKNSRPDVIEVPREFGSTKASWKSRVTQVFQRLTKYDSGIRVATDRCARVIQQSSSGAIWAILNSTAAIDIVWKLLPSLGSRQLLVQVWDDPRHLCLQRRLDRLTRHRTFERFQKLLKRADRVAVIGESMREEYERFTQAPMTIIRHGLDVPVMPREMPVSRDEFHIGFCGGMYSLSAWKTLQAALDLVDWTLSGRQVVLHLATSYIILESRKAADVRYYGWRSVEDTFTLMANCDLLYLPQAFDALSRPLTEWSFPTKLSTYASTGRPVLVHTPEYGSLRPFCEKHNFGSLCTHLNPERLAEQLQNLATDEEEYRRLARSTAFIGQDILTHAAFANAVCNFAGSRLAGPVAAVATHD